MKMYYRFLLFAGLFFASFSLEAHAEVKLADIFGDNMVLQQQTQVAIWGWAKPNGNVSVTGSWNNRTYNVKCDIKGYWRVKIATPAASFTPYTLTVSDGKSITLKNILIGEVWVCSGQSNMQWGMSDNIEGGPEAILSSNNPGIRFFTVQRTGKPVPQDVFPGQWEVANPQTTAMFSAVAYFFGRVINSAVNVPVGLISTNYGGSVIEAWMSPQALKDFPGKNPPAPDAVLDNWFAHILTPTALYNAMIHPIVGYGMRGVIWYQGESNRNEPDLYIKLFDTMVRDWRKLWDVGEFPVYFCQIAPYDNGGNGVNGAYFREAQAKCMKITPNTGMAVLMDSESFNDIHPAKKRIAGERLALWALAKTYGMDKIAYRSPEFKSLNIEGRMAVLTFETRGLTSYGKEIKNFRIAGKDKNFHPAKAVCSGNKVYVFSPAVAEPVAVRYCWDEVSASELYSFDGHLPMSSFRTDDW